MTTSSASTEHNYSRVDKLRFFKSPVVGCDGDDSGRSPAQSRHGSDSHGSGSHDDSLPEFERVRLLARDKERRGRE